MDTPPLKKAPAPSVKRLPHYLRFLRLLQASGRQAVSCTHIATDLRLDPTQVRKDLALTGIVGRPKVGYRVSELIASIEDFLGWNNSSDAFLAGAGHLGTALLGYAGLRKLGFQIVAAFDVAPGKIGQVVHGREVLSLDQMPGLAERMHIHIGVLTVPEEAAQGVVDVMVGSGIRAIWNFTPAQLDVPGDIILENVDLTSSLALLCSRLKAQLEGEASPPPSAARGLSGPDTAFSPGTIL